MRTGKDIVAEAKWKGGKLGRADQRMVGAIENGVEDSRKKAKDVMRPYVRSVVMDWSLDEGHGYDFRANLKVDEMVDAILDNVVTFRLDEKGWNTLFDMVAKGKFLKKKRRR